MIVILWKVHHFVCFLPELRRLRVDPVKMFVLTLGFNKVNARKHISIKGKPGQEGTKLKLEMSKNRLKSKCFLLHNSL